MSMFSWHLHRPAAVPPVPAPAPTAKPLHRLAEVRKEQGISLRNMARKLNIDISAAREQEESVDVPLSVLHAWQRVLDVPLTDLLIEDEAALSLPILQRAQLVKVMKTVAAIIEKEQSPSIKRLLAMLSEQLIEIMPELRDVGPWHNVGQRRSLDDVGRIVERQVSDDMFRYRAR